MEDKHLDIIANVKEKFDVSLKEFQKEVYVNILAGKNVFVSAPTESDQTSCFLLEIQRYIELNFRLIMSLSDQEKRLWGINW